MSDGSETSGDGTLPLVSVVFLAYNQRERLLESLRRMVNESGYPRLEVIVVDNASQDGTPAAVAAAHPGVRLVRSQANVGASAWNQGFAVATGSYVLILDDDAYLPPGGLETAVRAAAETQADLVSFAVVSSFDPDHQLDDDWRTGLLGYWGCAALVARHALELVGGYDPDIFIWGNEVEFTMRLLDLGFRHLYLPDVRAVHMKERITTFNSQRYLANARHHSYVAAKLMTPEDAAAVAGNIVAHAVVDALREDRRALSAIREAVIGGAAGVRRRRPVRRVVSRAYRRNFVPFISPWRLMRSPGERLRGLALGPQVTASQRDRRRERFFAERARFYPRSRASLRL